MEKFNKSHLRLYLLGDLPDDERELLETGLFTDEELFERMEEAEEELIDEYLTGDLSGDERERFERTFLASSAHRKRVELRRELFEIRPKASSPMQSDAMFVPFPPSFSPTRPDSKLLARLKAWSPNYRVSLGVVAAVRVAILTLLWFFIYRSTFASSFHSPTIFYLLTTLTALYVPLEAASLLRTIREVRRL